MLRRGWSLWVALRLESWLLEWRGLTKLLLWLLLLLRVLGMLLSITWAELGTISSSSLGVCGRSLLAKLSRLGARTIRLLVWHPALLLLLLLLHVMHSLRVLLWRVW